MLGSGSLKVKKRKKQVERNRMFSPMDVFLGNGLGGGRVWTDAFAVFKYDNTFGRRNEKANGQNGLSLRCD